MSFYWLYPVGFALSFGLALFLTRWLRGKAPALGLVDHPRGDRHQHGEPIATVGGIAIFVTVATTFFLMSAFAGAYDDSSLGAQALYPILLGAGAMHLLGIWDDLRGLSARAKFLPQVLIAVAVFLAGVRVSSVTMPFLGLLEFAFWPSLFLTVFWLVGITNAFNLVDGTDGLAGGAALLATLSMFVASLVFGNYQAALLLAVTAAALLGFLHFNFPPATVFLGDSGSLFLGFLLAGLGLASSTKAATVVAIAIPVVTLGLPVVDTLLAMTRRFLRGERLTSADRGHIHHRLIALGHSPRKVALLLYGVCAVLSLGSLILLSEDGRIIGLSFLIIGVAAGFGIQRLKLPELLELRRSLDRGLQQRQVIAGNLAMREGAVRVSRAGSLREIFEELGEALYGSPFERVEMWLSAEFIGDDGGAEAFPEVELADGGYVWRWRKVPFQEADSTRSWEIKLPLLSERGDQVGQLTLRRRFGHEIPTEVQVLANLLLPAVSCAVGRLRPSGVAHSPNGDGQAQRDAETGNGGRPGPGRTPRYEETKRALRAQPRRWLVTGAAGFIGSNLVETLLELDQHVVGLDNFATGHRRNIRQVTERVGERASNFRFVEGDIRDLDMCRDVCRDVEYVLHQAALGSVPRSLDDPLATHRANVDGFVNVALAARDAGVERFVYATSSSVYGDHPGFPRVEAAIGRPLSPYAATKQTGELYAGVFQHAYGLPTIGLRYFNVFGRRQDPNGSYAAVIPRWIERLLSGEECQIYGDGETSRDFCYIDDCVQANLLAATANAESTDAVYNVACGARTTLNELFRLLRDGIAMYRPKAADARPVHVDFRPGDMRHSLAEIGKIEARLGYRSTHSVSEGLEATLPWYVKRLSRRPPEAVIPQVVPA